MGASRCVEREVVGEIMRTDVFVRLCSADRSETDMRRDADEAIASIRDVARRFSRFDPESELSRFNDDRIGRVSPDFRGLLAEALLLHRETDGVFDPSVLGVLEREGYAASFGSDGFGVPRSGVGTPPGSRFGGIVIDAGGSVRKPVGMRIDFGGIAKGYAVDRAATMLRERGYRDFLVDAGGDMYASGRDASKGYPYWAVDVARPLGEGESVALLTVTDMAVATSGTDRRRWRVGEEIRHHLIDPRTGRSARTDIVSATVLGPTTVHAEVLAKTCCILGREEALEFARRRGIPALLVTEDGKTVYTAHMEPYVYETDR